MTHKQIILMRTDIGMNAGKMISQGAHASVAAILNAGEYNDNTFEIRVDDEDIGPWLKGEFTKIVIECNDVVEMQRLVDQAKEDGITTAVIIDNGRTVFNGVNTLTCAAIGPATNEKINKITGHLKTYR